jgi:hypothetical protein
VETKQQKPEFWRSGERTVIDSQKAEISTLDNDATDGEVTLYSQVYASRSLMNFLEQYAKYKHEAAVALEAGDIREHTQPIAAAGPTSQLTVSVIEEVEQMSRDLTRLVSLQEEVEQRLVKVMKMLEPLDIELPDEA